MSKYYFVGDIHLHDVNPRSRIDNYPQALLDKLKDVFNKASLNNIKAIFFLGDIFHKPSGLSTRYLNNVIETFQQSPCPCYTIIGNHDIPFNRVEDVDNTSLGILFKSKALQHLNKYDVAPGISIFGYDYNTDITYIEKPSDCKLGICLSHSYGEDVAFGDPEGKAEYFKWSKPNNNPFDVYILGHDHSSHDLIKVYDGKSWVARFGALARVTSASSDTQREINILEIDFNEENCTFNINNVKINYTPAVECFSQQSLDKPLNKNIDLSGSLEDVLSGLNFSIQSNIFDVIDSMDLDPKIIEILETYLRNNFITRKTDSSV